MSRISADHRLIGDGQLAILPWDCQHFQFSVAQIVSTDLDNHMLRETFRLARDCGIRLVYWATAPDRLVPCDLIREFCGMLVDWKVTYEKKLTTADGKTRAVDSPEVMVVEYPRGPASPRLLELGIISGVCSRFCVDPGIPRGAGEQLFAIWADRSARRELADIVLVAKEERDSPEILGMVTVARRMNTGSIGLIAVDGAAGRRGIGKALIGAAHRWMVGCGLINADVVTQQVNKAACALYERCGYTVRGIQKYYHFYPQRDVSS
jgi:dTDP-4-amino-4,6-dideoxy-D-galactose acyltransferase